MRARTKKQTQSTKITRFFKPRPRTLSKADVGQIATLMTRGDTAIIINKTIKWMDMTPEQQTESVQALSSSFSHHFC